LSRILEFPPKFRMLRPTGTLIITSDEEMERLEKDPGMKVRAFDSSFTDICRNLPGRGGAHVDVAYDFFFGGNERKYFPTSDQCIRTFRVLHSIAEQHGLGFGASVMSPLDLGPAYSRLKDHCGQTCQFREGPIDSQGRYDVQMPVQRRWFHNKGPVNLKVNRLEAFAFSERQIPGTSCWHVDPADIMDISPTARLEVDESTQKTTGAGYRFLQGRIRGKADGLAKRNRVLAVIVYDVEEMDYFHQDALPFLKQVIDDHARAGITYSSFYSDEMHIQFDWDLGTHFGPTEINTRYLTPGLVRAYSRLHGSQYRDFHKYLVYFAYAQHSWEGPDYWRRGDQHVLGPTPHDVYLTWKMRRDYFRLLQDHVVELFIQAKRYAEKLTGRVILTRAHATWQESPTCDHFDLGVGFGGKCGTENMEVPVSRYDYTPRYVWSSSIRESQSACYDYFRWGDYLTGMGTDHPEGGYIDRNYHGAALACSFGHYNELDYAYYGHWGAPQPVSDRVHDLAAAMGLGGGAMAHVQGWRHRKSPVLCLYPLDLNYVEERFGSWTVQYGYADYLTEEKFVELVHILPDGRFRLKDLTYQALVLLFEPLVLRKTFDVIEDILRHGGTVVWCSMPPAIFLDSLADVGARFLRIFGLRSARKPHLGMKAKDAVVSFEGALGEVPSFRIPTDFPPDLVFPVVPDVSNPVAWVGLGGRRRVVGALRITRAGGRALYLGFRPRDDQSRSTPDAPRTLFRVLSSLGIYSPSGPGVAEHASNTGDYLVAESPNGALSFARHYYRVVENWGGGFFRPKDESYDESALPSRRIELKDFRVGRRTINYDGLHKMAFLEKDGCLEAFCGFGTSGISIDGPSGRCSFTFADQPVDLAFAPVPAERLAKGVERAHFLQARTGRQAVWLPVPYDARLRLVVDEKDDGCGSESRSLLSPAEGGLLAAIVPDEQGLSLYLITECAETTRARHGVPPRASRQPKARH